jgi:glycosyltransferase involved in cell wall biosynthesis
MSREARGSAAAKRQIVFLFPLVYRPEKYNFAKRFALLSRWYEGRIFALSGARQRDIPVADFRFHSERFDGRAVSRLLRGLWVQVVVPLRILWRRAGVSVVVAYDPYRSGLAALVLTRVLGCKMIVELNGDYHRVEPGRSAVKQALMRLVFHRVLRGADAIKVLNADQERYCRQHFPHKAIYRFPSFVATEYFQSLESYQGDYLLSVGQPFDLKGMDVLIAAFTSISERHPRIGLQIMGYCPPADLAKYRALAGGHPRIAFVEPGWIEQVGEQLRGCYALVNAARTEALGRVHVEAMACGKPIIATRTNGALECIEDGRTGLLCAVGDVADLAAKLDELLSDPARAARMGDAARIRMQDRYSESAHALAYHDMLDRVIGRAAP